jgi:hypothetical protein
MAMFTSAIQDSTQTNYPFLAIVYEGGKSFAQFPCATRLDAESRIRETIRTLETMGPSAAEF